MKIALFGKNSDSIKSLVKTANFTINNKNPDLVISYGGDGTLLASEQKYPGIPKLPIRDSKTCLKCSLHTTEELLCKLKSKKLKLKKVQKIEVSVKDKTLKALNDIVIRNSTQIHAIRFSLLFNEKIVGPEVIVGDGVVISTHFGSTGYFKSITKKSFNEDFGLAFNNTVVPLKTIKFKKNDKIRITILRGSAQLSLDNNPKLISLKEKDQLLIKPSEKVAQILEPQTLRCQKCILHFSYQFFTLVRRP